MFARNISFHLKSNMLSDYTRCFEKDVLPLLRQQNGFKDEITFAGPGGVDVTASPLQDCRLCLLSGRKYTTELQTLRCRILLCDVSKQ